MPRVKSQKANKDYPAQGIKKGQIYYSWKFRYGGKRMSLTYPKPSQLTQSEYLGAVYDFQERIQSMSNEEILNGGLEDLYQEIETLKDETEEKKSNMPEQLQEVGSGEILTQRIDDLETFLSELDTVKSNAEDWYSEHGEKGYDLDALSFDEDEEEPDSAQEALDAAEAIIEEFRGLDLPAN